MTIEDVIYSLEVQAQDKDRLAGGDPNSYLTKEATALYEAIRMLHTKQTPQKLDRSQWDGCEFCNEQYCSDCYWWLKMFDNIGCSRCTDKSEWKPLVSYCSNCGKPLTEEAWADLERKLNENTGSV